MVRWIFSMCRIRSGKKSTKVQASKREKAGNEIEKWYKAWVLSCQHLSTATYTRARQERCRMPSECVCTVTVLFFLRCVRACALVRNKRNGMWFQRNNANDSKMIKGLSHGWTFLFLFRCLFRYFLFFLLSVLGSFFFLSVFSLSFLLLKQENIFAFVVAFHTHIQAFHFSLHRATRPDFDVRVFYDTHLVLLMLLHTLSLSLTHITHAEAEEINLFTTKIHCLIHVLCAISVE